MFDKKMKTLSLEDLLLDGYTEDVASLRAFERGYAPVTIPGVVGFAFGFYLIFWREQTTGGFMVSLISLVVIAGACAHAYFASPRSVRSGRRMERYRRSDARCEGTEFLYVDHDSRTFCRRMALGRGD